MCCRSNVGSDFSSLAIPRLDYYYLFCKRRLVLDNGDEESNTNEEDVNREGVQGSMWVVHAQNKNGRHGELTSSVRGATEA